MMHSRFSVIVLCLLVGVMLTAAQCFGDGSDVTIDVDSEPLPFDHVISGQHGVFADTTELVVKDNDQWQALTGRLPSGRAAETPDFEQYMVLIAALPVESGGYDVHFRSVEVMQERIIASYVIGVPGEDCITTMGVTTPFEAVAVRKVDLPVEFERTRELIRCTFR